MLISYVIRYIYILLHFQILPGDVLGISWINSGVVAYDLKKCVASGAPAHESDRYLLLEDLPVLKVGTIHRFQQAKMEWNPCRIYSVMAHIG